jgi:hypothetical protein
MISPFSKQGQAITTEIGKKAAAMAIHEAHQKGLRAALCGGLAMHLYGFTRATQDVNIICEDFLERSYDRPLSFGGAAYLIEVEDQQVEVDWIVREDDKKIFYEEALLHILSTEEGLPVLAPEMLVIIKHLAGRGKDHMDCVWLLRQDGLVNREKMIGIVKKIMGSFAFWAIQDLESLILEADLMRAKDEKNDKT